MNAIHPRKKSVIAGVGRSRRSHGGTRVSLRRRRNRAGRHVG